MEQYNWIKAYYTNDSLTEKEVFVRQEVMESETFVDDKGNRYHVSELDFTRNTFEPQLFNLEEFKKRNKEMDEQFKSNQEMMNKMLSSLDANAIADHKAKIDEREYWRKLRGEIFARVFDASPDSATRKSVLECTEHYFNALYAQDQEFFKDK